MDKILLLIVFICCISVSSGFEDKTIGQWLVDNNFSTLVSLLTTNGFITSLNNQEQGPFTLFAPTDAAFAKVPQATLNNITSDSGILNNVLTNHVVYGFVMDYAIQDGVNVTAANGATLTFSVQNGQKTVQNIPISRLDVILSNGVVHVIDSVMVPGVLPTVPPTVSIDSIGEILLMREDQFATLNLLLSLTDLEPVLLNGEFTLFAPVDSAFDAILDSLISFSDPNAKTFYTDILLKHVVAGTYLSTDLTDGQKLVTQAGPTITVHLSGTNAPRIENAPITELDIPARNGVIHVVSAVIT